MEDSVKPDAKPLPDRLASLDIFRGFTMFLLIAEGTGIYSMLTNSHGSARRQRHAG